MTGSLSHWSRRETLAALLAAPMAACVPWGSGGVEVVVVWSGEELSRFRSVTAQYDAPVNVISAGDDIDGFLRTRISAGNPPDVAVLPRPGLIREYVRRDWVVPVDTGVGSETGGQSYVERRYDQTWRDLVRFSHPCSDDPVDYGVWIKAAHKSLFWCRDDLDTGRLDTWSDLVTLVQGMAEEAGSGGPAPLAIGADDGWVLTDWFENALAAYGGLGFHDRLARGGTSWDQASVHKALADLAEVWRIEGAFPGGPVRARLTQFEESVMDVVARGRASMVLAPDFARLTVERFGDPDDFTTFPAAYSTSQSRIVVTGGDCAVVMRTDTESQRRAQDFLQWLTEPATFNPWISEGAYLTPNLAVAPNQYRDLGRSRAEGTLLREVQAPGRERRFDLSDRLPAEVGGGPGSGLWGELQHMFADVAGVGSGEGADDLIFNVIERVKRNMVRLSDAQGEAC